MSHYYQGSLLDAGHAPAIGDLAPVRTVLGDGAWVDVLPGWIAGSDDLFLHLQGTVPWHAERREMYDRVVDVPRLLCHVGAGEPLPDPVLVDARERLSDHYEAELGERFATAGLCLYRDGRDSVAWHGDRIGRGRTDDTMVAIVSLGAARRLSLRPRGGGRQVGFALGHGDLVVMGGSCQRTWDHAILKTARPVGPRISIQFRPRGVLCPLPTSPAPRPTSPAHPGAVPQPPVTDVSGASATSPVADVWLVHRSTGS